MWISCRKNARSNLQKVNPQHNRRNTVYMNTDILKHDFRVTASWQWQKMSKDSTLSFHAGAAGDTSRTLRSSTRSDWLPTKLRSRAAIRCESTDEASVVVHAWLCSNTFSSWDSGILKQRVSETVDRTSGPTAWPVHSSDLNLLPFMSRDI